MAVARRIVGTEEDARDVLQEAYTSAFKALPRFEGQAKLSGKEENRNDGQA